MSAFPRTTVEAEHVHFIPQYGDARVHTSTRCACDRPAVLVAKYSRVPQDVTCTLCIIWMTKAQATRTFYNDDGILMLCDENSLVGKKFYVYLFTMDIRGWWTVMRAAVQPLYHYGDPRQIL